MKPEVLKSWSLEIDYSRAPCLGADQNARGLWERDWTITCPRMNMNFIFKHSTRNLMSECVSRWTWEDKIHIHKQACNILLILLYKHQWIRHDLLCNHNDGYLFPSEDEHKCKHVIFTCKDILSFRTRAHLVFYWCLYNKIWLAEMAQWEEGSPLCHMWVCCWFSLS